MEMPNSYMSSYMEREKVIERLTADGSLEGDFDVDKAIDYVEGIHSSGELQGFLEALEDLGMLFPNLPYNSYNQEMEYLNEDSDYNLYNVIQSFALVGESDLYDINVAYYRLVPYQVGDKQLASIAPVSKERVLKDLHAYRNDDQFVFHEAEHAPRGIADHLQEYKNSEIDLAQNQLWEVVDYGSVNLIEIYRSFRKVISQYLTGLTKLHQS